MARLFAPASGSAGRGPVLSRVPAEISPARSWQRDRGSPARCGLDSPGVPARVSARRRPRTGRERWSPSTTGRARLPEAARSHARARPLWCHAARGLPRRPAARRAQPPLSAARHPGETLKSGSFDECHLVDFPKGGHPLEDPFDGTLAQESHAFFARRLLDFGCRPLLENHLADPVSQVEELADGLAPLVACPVTLDAADTLVEPMRMFERRIE